MDEVQGLSRESFRRIIQWWRDEPVVFVREILGIELWSKQKEIIEGIRDNPRITVRSCSGAGKTVAAACTILWFLYCFRPATVLTTGKSFRQVKEQLWRDIGAYHSRARIPLGGDINQTNLNISEDWFALGFSTDEPERITGFHNENVLVVVDEACFDDKTEILTQEGWKFFSLLKDNDKVLTLTKRGQGEFKKPDKLISLSYEGEMLHLQHRACDICITPNHNMYYGSSWGKWQIKEAKELKSVFYLKRNFKWRGSTRKSFLLPFMRFYRQRYNRRYVDIGDWVEWLGWYLSEGSRNEYKVVISQKDKDRLEEIKKLSERLDFPCKIYENEVHISSQLLANIVGEYGNGACSKFVPQYIKELPPKHINRFLSSYLKGDGYIKQGREIYYTSSPQMADDLQELILKTGDCSSVRLRHIRGQRKWIIDHWAESKSDGYVISRYKQVSLIKVRPRNIKKEYYKGKVYCVDVPPSHLIFTRRNGHCVWTGNSGLSDNVYGAIENPLSAGNTKLLLLGNPTQSTGKFKDSFASPLYKSFHISAFDTPNLLGEEGYPFLVNAKAVENAKIEWGVDSPLYEVYILGEFPSGETDRLIPFGLAEAAIIAEMKEEGTVAMGVDTARFGDDENVLYVRKGNKVVYHKVWTKADTGTTINQIASKIREYKPSVVNIDEGYNPGVIDGLVAQKFNVNGISFGGQAKDPKTFANIRAEMWWELAERFKRGEIQIPNDKILLKQLTDIKKKPLNRLDQIILESKQEMKQRGLKSPDRADALALCFYELPRKSQSPLWWVELED